MESWTIIDTYPDRGSAESLALMFRSEGVPSMVRATGVVGIVELGFQVLVDPKLEHRARWLLAQSRVTDQELESLATASFGGDQGRMTADSVLEILDLFKEHGIDVWLDGGWGVDALLGQQTRAHDDLDVIVRVEDATRIRESFRFKGFAPKLGGSTTNYVLADSLGRELDVHAIAFDEHGFGSFHLPDGRKWPFPPSAFRGQGRVTGYPVRCLSPEAQVMCHGQGYAPTQKDFADMENLQRKFGVVLPLILCRQS